jgi:hypothetical protein
MKRNEQWFAFSVDLEPNKDDTLDGIRDAMEWFDETIPRGTVYSTHRIATELPDIVSMLAIDHEIGAHVHPREFGHEHDQLAELPVEQQRELILTTRESVAEAAGVNTKDIVSFRAGRHSASGATFDVLTNLSFEVDASINVRYTDYLPPSLTEQIEPFYLDTGLLEVPTTYFRPSILSRAGLRIFPQRELTATANTLRTDSPVCSGHQAMRGILSSVSGISMYMHPYDATEYHSELENNGETFRYRVSSLLTEASDRFQLVTAREMTD